jgi:hypothetical protein
MKVFDTINPREGIEIGEAADEAEALKMLTEHFAGTGEDRLRGVALADYDHDWRGEVYVPKLVGINA